MVNKINLLVMESTTRVQNISLSQAFVPTLDNQATEFGLLALLQVGPSSSPDKGLPGYQILAQVTMTSCPS